MKKCNIGMFYLPDSTWNGGVNYYNRMFKLSEYDDNYKFFGFCNKNKISTFNSLYKNVTFVGINPIIYRIRNKLFGIINNYYLKKYNIKIVLNSGTKFKNCIIINWVADFQFYFLSEFYSKHEVTKKNKIVKDYFEKSDRVILSSNTALQDANKFLGYKPKNYFILRFPSNIEPDVFNSMKRNFEDDERLKCSGKYIFMPNQFWVHKNHMTAFNAIKILKENKTEIKLICSGSFYEWRKKNYKENLFEFISHNKLKDNIIIHENLSYHDVLYLLKFSHALLNPSLFEGWSTTVEEAKLINKRRILSDLPIHREQSTTNTVFFNPNDANSLAEKLLKVWSEEYYWSELVEAKIYTESIVQFNNKLQVLFRLS